MDTIITKKALDQSLEFFSELNLEEEDYVKILETFKGFLENPENKQLTEKFLKIDQVDKNQDFHSIIKAIIDSNNMSYLNLLLQKIIKNEEIINEIQDIFLEKLL